MLPATCLTSFVHDNIKGEQNQPLPPWVDDDTVRTLERAGLVRVVNIMERRVDREARLGAAAVIVPVTPGKVAAAGEGEPASSSPAARPSSSTTTPTSQPSRRGRPPGRKNARS